MDLELQCSRERQVALQGRSDRTPPESPTPCAYPEVQLIYNHMVVYPSLTNSDIDRVFRALADSTRRDIIARVLVGEQSVSELADRYDMSFAAVQKHVSVLERAGLVTKRPEGRERYVIGNPDHIAKARNLLTHFEGLWKARIRQLDAILAEQ